jgi:hypothetical protein
MPKPNPNTIRVLLVTMADTTWRMFIPPAVLVSIGIWADLKIGTSPWLAVVGTILGLIGSVFLIKQQLKGVK